MQITETDLQFNAGLKVRRRTVREVLHHSAGATGNAYQFHQQHLGQGWAGIGYHFVILPDGTIQRGRPEQYIGSHAGSNGNGDSLGINFVGNFTDHEPTEAQIQSYLWLHQRNIQIYGPLAVQGHNEIMQTACPGAMFPMARIKQLIEGGSNMANENTGDNPSDWAVTHTEWAKKKQIINGDGQGNYDWQGNLTREGMAAILHNFVEVYELDK